MKLSHLGWLKRTWPLALSVLAVCGIARVLPQMYSDFEFSRHGIPVPAWYTDLNQDEDVFRYAYVVRDVTYGGQASWNDADSNIYSHKPGDEFRGVQYLSTKPWLSICRRDPKVGLRDAKTWIALNGVSSYSAFGCTGFVFRNAVTWTCSRVIVQVVLEGFHFSGKRAFYRALADNAQTGQLDSIF